MSEEKEIKKTGKMKKLEKKITKLTEKNNTAPKKSIEKKIMKLEKKKEKLSKWLKIKLPFRFLIKTGVIWLIIGGVCYGCSYVPVLKEVKMATMMAVSYVAPEPVVKVLDVVTLNVGVNDDDFEWLKIRLQAYMNGEVEIESTYTPSESYHYFYGPDGYEYYIGEKQVSEEEYKKYQADIESQNQEQQAKTEELVQDILGTTSEDEVATMSISEILMKVATNSTPEIVSKILDMAELTDESRQIIEYDVNRALKILPKLNNNQMNELVEIIDEIYQESLEAQKDYQKAVEEEQELLQEQEELVQQIMQQYQNQ